MAHQASLSITNSQRLLKLTSFWPAKFLLKSQLIVLWEFSCTYAVALLLLRFFFFHFWAHYPQSVQLYF